MSTDVETYPIEVGDTTILGRGESSSPTIPEPVESNEKTLNPATFMDAPTLGFRAARACLVTSMGTVLA